MKSGFYETPRKWLFNYLSNNRKRFFPYYCLRHLPIVGVEFPPVRHEPRPAVVDEGAQEDSVVPVVCEVLELAVGQDGLQPGQHQLLGREVWGTQLVVGNQGPDQAQDQLQVAIVDISVAWKRVKWKRKFSWKVPFIKFISKKTKSLGQKKSHFIIWR